MLDTIANVCELIGFALTIILLVRSESLRKEVEGQRIDYTKEQKAIRETLKSLRTTIIEDGIFNQKVVSDIRTNLYSYDQKFQRLLSRGDKVHLKKTLCILEIAIDDINQNELCTELDYFIARFQRKERKI